MRSESMNPRIKSQAITVRRYLGNKEHQQLLQESSGSEVDASRIKENF